MWNGTYCDRGTGKCENCVDICIPSRGTMSECLENATCKDFWPVSTTTDNSVQQSDFTSSGSFISPGVSTDTVAASVSIVIAIFIILVLIFTCLWRNGKLKRFLNWWRRPARELKPPVQLSTQEQEKEELEKLNAIGVDKCAGTSSAPEVNHFVPTM